MGLTSWKAALVWFVIVGLVGVMWYAIGVNAGSSRAIYTPTSDQLREDAIRWCQKQVAELPPIEWRAIDGFRKDAVAIANGDILWNFNQVNTTGSIYYDAMMERAKLWHNLSESEKQKFIKTQPEMQKTAVLITTTPEEPEVVTKRSKK